jgi:hypothetical protein
MLVFLQCFGSSLGFVNFLRVKDLLCDILQLFVAAGLQCPVKAGLVTDVTLAGIDGHGVPN